MCWNLVGSDGRRRTMQSFVGRCNHVEHTEVLADVILPHRREDLLLCAMVCHTEKSPAGWGGGGRGRRLDLRQCYALCQLTKQQLSRKLGVRKANYDHPDVRLG